MELFIQVNWPVTRLVCLPRSETIANLLHDLRLRPDLLHHDVGQDRLVIRHLFGIRNKVCDVDRYMIRRRSGVPGFAIVDHAAAENVAHLATYP